MKLKKNSRYFTNLNLINKTSKFATYKCYSDYLASEAKQTSRFYLELSMNKQLSTNALVIVISLLGVSSAIKPASANFISAITTVTKTEVPKTV